MNDDHIVVCVGVPCVVAAYGIYCLANPGSDGAVFATVMSAIGGLIGYVVGSKRGYRKGVEVVSK